jgi:outer membrane protease
MFLPRDSGTAIRRNTQMHVSHKITQHAQTKGSTQTIDTLHATNTIRKSKTIPLTGCRGL